MSLSTGCGTLDEASKNAMFELQNLDYINATIVQNTWYTPLTTTRNVKAWYLIVEQTNNGAAIENIVIELTINGTTQEVLTAMNSGAQYYLRLGIAATGSCVATARQILALDDDQSAPLETKTLQIRVRQTSAVDVVSASIEVNMVYATLTNA